jgi:hypothetical protein
VPGGPDGAYHPTRKRHRRVTHLRCPSQCGTRFPTINGGIIEGARADERGCIICVLVAMVDLPQVLGAVFGVTIRLTSIPNGYLVASARLAILLE